MIDIVEEGVDGIDALDDAAGQKVPLLRIENPRDNVEGDQPFVTRLFAIDGESDAEAAEHHVRLFMFFDEKVLGDAI